MREIKYTEPYSIRNNVWNERNAKLFDYLESELWWDIKTSTLPLFIRLSFWIAHVILEWEEYTSHSSKFEYFFSRYKTIIPRILKKHKLENPELLTK